MRVLKGLLIWLACVLMVSPAHAAARDWSRTVSATKEGGYLIGNPAARVKVIEYFSLTCPHCRHFAATGMAPLKSGYVAKGTVSLELRNFVLNGPDMSASILMRCGSPALAVRLFEVIYADQEKLFAGVYSLGEGAAERIRAVPENQRAATLAREAGIDRWFAAKGVPPRRGAACLADPKREQQLANMVERAATTLGVEGTPTFFVNGVKIEGSGWDTLEPAIIKALQG